MPNFVNQLQARNSFLKLALLLAVVMACSCNYYTHDYFAAILGDKNCELDRICDFDNVTWSEDGMRNEVYQLNENTYATFVHHFGRKDSIDLPVRDLDMLTEDSILTWRKTPIKSIDTLIINVKKIQLLYNNCFTINELQQVLNTKGSFYCAYYSKSSWDKEAYKNSYRWFILNGRNRKLYLIKN